MNTVLNSQRECGLVVDGLVRVVNVLDKREAFGISSRCRAFIFSGQSFLI